MAKSNPEPVITTWIPAAHDHGTTATPVVKETVEEEISE